MLTAAESLAAIIVTYNCDSDRVIKLISQLQRQNANAIVIDNSDIKNNELEVHADWYCWLGGNKGIAAAQNIGITYGLNTGYQYFIFFDQDSAISDSFLITLYSHAKNEGYEVCAPVFFDEEKGFEYAITDIKKNGRRIKIRSAGTKESFTSSTVISSGTLVNKDVFEKVGLMDETLFIDYVDTEWCLRCFSKGILVHIIPQARMLHSIGDKSLQISKFTIPVHSAIRRYYRVRNSILLFRYSHVPKRLALREVCFCVIHSIILIMTQKNKPAYLKTFLKGIFDGLKGKTGKMAN